MSFFAGRKAAAAEVKEAEKMQLSDVATSWKSLSNERVKT